MVFVDDAHLLDDGSATLVHQLALTGAAARLAALAAEVDGDLVAVRAAYANAIAAPR